MREGDKQAVKELVQATIDIIVGLLIIACVLFGSFVIFVGCQSVIT